MKRRAFVGCALALAALPAWAAPERFARGVLWRVSRKGIAPSHVYGTLHVPDPRLADLPPPVRVALEGARSLMVEFLPDGYARERFLEAAMFQDRQTLTATIGAEDFERALAQLKPLGLPREFVDKLKPWGVLINLREAVDVPEASLDAQLLERARARRLPLHQIEGVEEQIFTVDELPMVSQVALLRHNLAHRDELRELAQRTVDAYLVRDLEAIWRLRADYAARYPEIAPHQDALTKRVLIDRSVVMAFRMQRQVRQGGALVAVGALHLYGSRGVLALLEGDGYRASRVY